MMWAIVLAAGRSRRMGAPKVLLPFGRDTGQGAGQDIGQGIGQETRGDTGQDIRQAIGQGTVIGRIVDQISKSRVDGIIVVVGAERERIAEALRGRDVKIVENSDPDGDMLSSIRCGLRALPDGCEAVLVALGDQPRIAAETIDAMVHAYEMCRAQDAGSASDAHRMEIVVPVHRGGRGHPVLFAARYSSEILERHDGTGLRGLLGAHPEDVLELEVPDPTVLCDMDSPEDYRREMEASEG
jgi:molybdenum cofactor cytidylyltransferase